MIDKQKKIDKLIKHLAAHGNLVNACRAAQLAHRTVYHWIETDPEFKRSINLAKQKFLMNSL